MKVTVRSHPWGWLLGALLVLVLAACDAAGSSSDLRPSDPQPQERRDVADGPDEPTPSPTPANEPEDGAVPDVSADPDDTATPAHDAPAQEAATASLDDWPDEQSTGVPSGVTLKQSGTVKVTEDGTVINGLDVSGSIIIKADDVTVRNTRIRAPSTHYPIDVEPGTVGTLVEDVEIDGGGNSGVAICCSNYTLRRADVHNSFDGPRMDDNTVVEDSYIHDLVAASGTHNDGIQSTGGDEIVVRGNHISNENSQTSAILIAPSLKPVTNVTVEKNLLRGGGYTLYFFDRGGSVEGNRFDESHKYGAVHGDTYAATWESNAYLDGTAIRCPSC